MKVIILNNHYRKNILNGVRNLIRDYCCYQTGNDPEFFSDLIQKPGNNFAYQLLLHFEQIRINGFVGADLDAKSVKQGLEVIGYYSKERDFIIK